MNERLVWIDCEMTGIDLRNDALVEIAALVTDFDLNVLGDGVDVIIKPPAEALDQMIDFVRTMHETSGLLAELENGITLREDTTTLGARVDWKLTRTVAVRASFTHERLKSTSANSDYTANAYLLGLRLQL